MVKAPAETLLCALHVEGAWYIFTGTIAVNVESRRCPARNRAAAMVQYPDIPETACAKHARKVDAVVHPLMGFTSLAGITAYEDIQFSADRPKISRGAGIPSHHLLNHG